MAKDQSISDWISAVASFVGAQASLLGSIAAFIGAVAAIGALVAVLAVRKQVRLQRRQMKLDLENFYVARYWVIMDNLDDVAAGTAERKRHIVRYLRLSEDQCDLRARKRITDSTWRYWRSGILDQLADDEFADALKSLDLQTFGHLRKLQADHSYEPLGYDSAVGIIEQR